MNPVHLCIGAPRAGTTWLFRELNHHQSVFLPTVKEVRYWNARRSDAETQSTLSKAMQRVDKCHDVDTQLAWLNKWQKIAQKNEPSIEQYLDLMSIDDRVTVDISPTYCFLPKKQIVKLREGLPAGSKVLYLVRDPLQRLSSQLKLHYFLHGTYRGVPSFDDIDVFLSNKNQRMRWNYAQVISQWKEVFGDDFVILDYDNIHQPKNFIYEISEILQFELDSNIERRDDDSFSHSDKNQNKQTLLPSLWLKEKKLLAHALLSDVDRMSSQIPDKSELWKNRLDNVIDKPLMKQEYVSSLNIEVQKLMRMTESLGDNCEYGFWQRDQGYEPSSLFRWAITPIKALNEFLSSPVALYKREDLVPHSPAMVTDQSSGFKFHSKLVQRNSDGDLELKVGDEFDDIYHPEAEKIEYLHDKFFFQLKKKPGLYIVKSNKGIEFEDVQSLAALLNTGRVKHLLVWVIESEDNKVTLNELEDGIFQGSVPNFAKYVTANEYHPTGWTKLMSLLAKEPKVKSMIDRMFR